MKKGLKILKWHLVSIIKVYLFPPLVPTLDAGFVFLAAADLLLLAPDVVVFGLP